ncbi:hypothetical protein CSC81_18930 [Tenacibaculum discolor]|uniref:tRNA synthetases class I catalytic domain-containing protein n=1 Tax=Tenacibaculum discolor TaxID=361581 RepID=A0A2G1BP62_9FLAO|nr:hypothetical protein CSC81_18930 [Tenacibaculum discolor]
MAQSQTCSGVTPVNYWMHTNMLLLNRQRMSKSTGNLIRLNEISAGDNNNSPNLHDALVVRYSNMQAHERRI